MQNRNPANRRRELGGVLRDFVRDLDPDKFKRELKALAIDLPVLKQFEAVRRWLDQPVAAKTSDAGREAPAPRRSRSGRAKKAYIAPSDRPAVRPAHSLPRQGRSSWLEGLLRGPWG